MTRKRKRKRAPSSGRREAAPGGYRQAVQPPAGTRETGEAGSGTRAEAIEKESRGPARKQGAPAAEPEQPRRGGGRLSESLRATSPFPPFTASLQQGLVAAARSPALVAFPMVVVLLWWLALVGLGLDHFPTGMVDLLAISPVGAFIDLQTGGAIYGLSSTTLVYMLAATVVRSVTWAVLTGMVVEALDYRLVTAVGVLRGLRAFPAVLLAHVMNVGLIFLGNFVLPGFFGLAIGQLAFTAALVGGLFLFVFAPVVAVREGRPAREAVRLSVRASLVPGPRHVVMVFVYFVVGLTVLVQFTPNAGTFDANPSIVRWVYVLAGTYLHVAFLGVFAYRWIAVGAAIPDHPLQLRRAGAGRTGAGRGGSRTGGRPGSRAGSRSRAGGSRSGRR